MNGDATNYIDRSWCNVSNLSFAGLVAKERWLSHIGTGRKIETDIEFADEVHPL